MMIWRIGLTAMLCLPWLSQAQHPKQFIQAELVKTIKAKSAKVGDPVKARAINAVVLPSGISISEGNTLLGEVRAVESNSISISFDQLEQGGKKTAVGLSVRAAMMPGETQQPTAAQTGSVIGMPGVTLHVDDSPQHASKFESSGKALQLEKGLQLMLAAPE